MVVVITDVFLSLVPVGPPPRALLLLLSHGTAAAAMHAAAMAAARVLEAQACREGAPEFGDDGYTITLSNNFVQLNIDVRCVIAVNDRSRRRHLDAALARLVIAACACMISTCVCVR